MYIKKPNGGVHTARNAGIREARGVFSVSVDSDDELLEDALRRFYEIWESIPEDERGKYRGICAQCMDQNGKRVGAPFPENINSVPAKQAVQMSKDTRGEHKGINLLSILKENPWPEPEGVTLVLEGVIWKRLRQNYRVYYSNELVQVYHTEGNDHLTNRRMSIQTCRNNLWSMWYCLVNPEYYYAGLKDYFRTMLRYALFCSILEMKGDDFP